MDLPDATQAFFGKIPVGKSCQSADRRRKSLPDNKMRRFAEIEYLVSINERTAGSLSF